MGPSGPPAVMEPISFHALVISADNLSKSAKNSSQLPLLAVVELFLADLDNSSADIAKAWTEIGSTTAGGPKGVTADMISNIWTISHEMAVKTIALTSQLNQEGEIPLWQDIWGLITSC